METNKKNKVTPVFTHEGARADNVNSYLALKRSILSTLLWEDSFYEDGVSISERIADLVPKVQPEKVAELAVLARTKFKLRHAPLFLVREMARHDSHKPLVADTLAQVIERADELAEALAIYWKQGKTPIANSFKKGLAQAFTKFDEFALSRYNQDNAIKLRDVLFLTHAKPLNKNQGNLWKRLVNNELKTPDTWEVELSGGKGVNQRESWERLLKQEKLGSLALLRNLNNFKKNGVNEKLIVNALENMNVERVLPFRFITAARYYPSLEPALEKAMFKCIEGFDKINGKTVLLIDVSGSMQHRLSGKSDVIRMDTACGLVILARELCKNTEIFTFSRQLVEVPNRRGFALRDAIINSQEHRDTFMGDAIDQLNNMSKYDRLIVFTDEQSAQEVPNPTCEKAYMINISNEKHGIGYKKPWTHLDGFSENILDYVKSIEDLER